MANVVNPYNFVPLEHAPSRTALDAYYTGKLLTGRLDYTLTTDTPLLIPDSAKVVKDEKIDHKRYPFFRLPDGTPAIAGSEMRGAMRAVYEAVTNSCLSVLLDSTEEPFSQRLPSTNGFKDHGLLGIDPETGKWVLYAADVVDYLKLSEGRDGSLMCNGWLNWYGHEYHPPAGCNSTGPSRCTKKTTMCGCWHPRRAARSSSAGRTTHPTAL